MKIRLYIADMADWRFAEMMERSRHLLDDPMRSRLSSYRDETAALHSLTSFLLTGAALKREGYPRGSLHILRDGFRKPYAEGLPVHFNLSHSGRWCVCAVSERPVGVDVQEYRRIDRNVARRFFSGEESRRLDGLEGDAYLREFFRIWSFKESYIKCIGKGLAHPLSSFTVPAGDGDVSLEGVPAKIFFLDGYALALCGEGEFPGDPEAVSSDELFEP